MDLIGQAIAEQQAKAQAELERGFMEIRQRTRREVADRRLAEVSYTTDVIVRVPLLESSAVTDEIAKPIPMGSHGEALQRLTGDEWGGYKGNGAPELWAAAFNYLDWPAFADWIAAMPWSRPASVEVLVQSEHDDLFAVWRLGAVSRGPARYRLVRVLSAEHTVSTRGVPRTIPVSPAEGRYVG